MGLTEGEGAKDVSDQIESQDQLEDAKRDYNNETVPDKDLKVMNYLICQIINSVITLYL